MARRSITAADRALVMSPEGERKLIARIPATLPAEHRARLAQLIQQSLTALRNGDDATAAARVKEIQTTVGSEAGAGGPWQRCGDECSHFLQDGKPAAYVVCYCHCVIEGGPVQPPPRE